MISDGVALRFLWGGLFLAACFMAVQSWRDSRLAAGDGAAADADPPQCRAVVAGGRLVTAPTAEMARYFPLSRYESFPAGIRSLIQRADFEHGACRGRGDIPETFRACNRSHCVMLELERRGWCWGGGRASFEDRWLRCSEIPEDPPMNRDLPYPEEEIREMFPEARDVSAL